VSEAAGTLITDLDRQQDQNRGGNGFKAYAYAQQGISAMVAAELLWKERRFLVRSTVYFLAIVAIIAFVLPNHYTAVTRLMPANYGSGSSMALALPSLSEDGVTAGGALGMASKLLGISTSGDLLAGVIRSETVENGVIKKLDLMSVYSDKYLEDCRKHLESHTSVVIDPKTDIISISVSDKKPARAAQIANAYVAELNAALADMNTSSAHRERVFLEQRLQQIQQQSETDAKEFALFASQNAAVDIPDQARSMVAAGAQLQSQLIVAQAELKGLEQIYSDNNARVRAARARVDELENQVNRFGGKNVNPTTDASLGEDQLYPSVRQLPLLGVKYLDLYRRSKVDDAVFELLTKEYEVAKIQEAREIPTAQVLDVALAPEKKSSPHRLLIMLSSILIGFILSSTYVIGCAVWENTDEGDRRKQLASEIFSTIVGRIDRIPLLGSGKRGIYRIFTMRGHP